MEENAGNLVRSLRQKLGMTQEEFAHEIAVTVSTVNRWENAHAAPSKLAWKAIQGMLPIGIAAPGSPYRSNRWATSGTRWWGNC